MEDWPGGKKRAEDDGQVSLECNFNGTMLGKIKMETKC